VGGVRTTLFNWLYARHNGGKFLLRIEDTDRERSTPDAVQVILDGLKWLGLESDEPVVYQSARIRRHKDAGLRLLDDGHAYRCFCDPAELEKRRDEARAAGKPYKYDRRCLRLTQEEIDANLAAAKPFAVRLRVPDEDLVFTDGVHGEVRVAGSELEDFVLLRNDGTPTYMLAVVVDDADMGITHIIRGDEHLLNSPKQILIYRALGLTPPQFAHVPLILGTDKKKLSKRHGATSVTWYKERGYLSETMINYLGLLGWSPGDDRNEISRDELITLFDIPGILPRGAVFDDKKLLWLNGQYISRTEFIDVAERLCELALSAVHAGRLKEMPSADRIKGAWNLMRSRIHLVNDLFETCLYLFQPPESYDPKGVQKYFTTEGIGDRLKALAEGFAGLELFTADEAEKFLRAKAEEWGVNSGALIHPVRLAVSGVTVGPGVFEMLEFLGRGEVVGRINVAAESAVK
jgi:glutamyl-tRNA synthetase